MAELNLEEIKARAEANATIGDAYETVCGACLQAGGEHNEFCKPELRFYAQRWAVPILAQCAMHENKQLAADVLALLANDAGALASVVTRQRSEIDMLRDVPLLAVEWSKLRDQIQTVIGERDTLTRQLAAACALLTRLREWDMMSTADGPYWQAEIDKVVTG